MERTDGDRRPHPLSGVGVEQVLRLAAVWECKKHNGWIPRDFWLEAGEKRAIVDFHARYPLEGYRRLTFMMLDADVVATSPASVWGCCIRRMCSRVRWNEANRVNADATALPFKDGSFELVSCNMVFEHLYNPQSVLDEACRVPTADGVLLIHAASSVHYQLLVGRVLSAVLSRHLYVKLVSRYTGRAHAPLELPFSARPGNKCALGILESGGQKLMPPPSIEPPSLVGGILSDNPTIDLLVPHQGWNGYRGQPPTHSFAKEIAPEIGGSSFSRSSHLMKSVKAVFLFPWCRSSRSRRISEFSGKWRNRFF